MFICERCREPTDASGHCPMALQNDNDPMALEAFVLQPPPLRPGPERPTPLDDLLADRLRAVPGARRLAAEEAARSEAGRR